MEDSATDTVQGNPADFPIAGLWRRLVALLYDGFLVAAIWMVLGYLIQFAFGTDTNQLVDGRVVTDPLQDAVIFFMMVTTSFGFYAWFWGRSGQTLGMIAWRLRAQRPDGQLLTLPQSALRFGLAWPSFFLLGIGFFWLLINRQQGTLHDRFSDTRVVLVPRSYRPF
ncbi:MAG: RDD family protein [Pseudohongiellaceae bacterium]|jgi:uncharacterized RDD family membrane protein YckC